MAKLLYTVLRDFPHSEPMFIGKEVDVSDWRNYELLEQQGYIVKKEVAADNAEEIIFLEDEIVIEEKPATKVAAKSPAKPEPAKAAVKKTVKK